MSSSDEASSDAENSETSDSQFVFVTLLKDFVILFDKRMTPQVKSEKEKALQNLTSAFNLNTKQQLEPKQVLKKFNNMKTKVKKLTDLRRTGNKKIKLNAWQQNFLDLWHKNSENPVLSKIPGAKSAGCSDHKTVKRPHAEEEDGDEEDDRSEDDTSTKSLKKTFLLTKIKAAETNVQAAQAQIEATRAITRAANAVEQMVERYFVNENS